MSNKRNLYLVSPSSTYWKEMAFLHKHHAGKKNSHLNFPRPASSCKSRTLVHKLYGIQYNYMRKFSTELGLKKNKRKLYIQILFGYKVNKNNVSCTETNTATAKLQNY